MNRIAIVVFSAVLIVLLSLLVAAAAGKFARLDGATYPAAMTRAATAFAATLTLAAAVTGAIALLLP